VGPNEGQKVAIAQMLEHARTTGHNPFFVLQGPAGTGKTYCLKELRREFKGRTMFTAPTNKATRVLRENLNADGSKEECRTIYSALGLKMEPNGEVKELAKPEEDIDLSEYRLIVVDECGMIGAGTEAKPGLMHFINEAACAHPKLNWIFPGDQYQLPPVGEASSPIWTLEAPKAELTKIERQDNQILTLSGELRGMVQRPFGGLVLKNDNDGEEGVWSLAGGKLDIAMLNQAQSFLKGESKAIAWRNVEVDRLNGIIRQELFADAVVYPWQPGDRITLLGPVKNLEGDTIGTTDEEGAVEKCDVATHPLYPDIDCYRIVMRSDLNTSLDLWVVHPKSVNKFALRKARLADTARQDRSQWKEFWNFVDGFAPVRHAYAITAHRAQGSTYLRAFVSWRDILRNPNRGEAMRCLYVAATRPKKELYLG
jgi:DNA polymerase III delta prime subunit